MAHSDARDLWVLTLVPVPELSQDRVLWRQDLEAWCTDGEGGVVRVDVEPTQTRLCFWDELEAKRHYLHVCRAMRDYWISRAHDASRSLVAAEVGTGDERSGAA